MEIKNFMKTVAVIILAVIILAGGIFTMRSWGTIPPGHVGVYVRFGEVTGTVAHEGFYWRNPITEDVVVMDCRVTKEEVNTECASRDLQTVDAVIALNLALKPDNCAKMLQTCGLNYHAIVVDPAVKEAYKSVVAEFSAERLITEREKVREGIVALTKQKLEPYGFVVSAVNIVNFKFSNTFNSAIEAKVTAEQNALAAKNMLAQKEYEAQQAVATAKGKAEALTLESAALAKNPQILQLKALEKWDGKMPLFVGGGGSMMMFDMQKMLNAAER